MHERTEHHQHRAQPGAPTGTDPVCGMKMDTLVVDKTGTLTEGGSKLVSVVMAPGFDEVPLLRLAATLERGSEHPLAAAMVKGAEDRKVAVASAEDFDSVTGKGVQGRVDGRGA